MTRILPRAVRKMMAEHVIYIQQKQYESVVLHRPPELFFYIKYNYRAVIFLVMFIYIYRIFDVSNQN